MASASAHKSEMDIAVYTDGQKGPCIWTFAPDAPVPIQLYRCTRFAAGAQQQEGIGPLEGESSLAR